MVGIYTVQVSSITIGGVSETTFTGTSLFVLTVVDPCATTNIIPNGFAAITAQVFRTPSTASVAWADGVSISTNNGFLQCGNLVFTTIVVTSPPTYVDATMNIMFSYST